MEESYIIKNWEYIIEKVQKYFKCKVSSNECTFDVYTKPVYGTQTIYEFIISPRKQWAFDMLSKSLWFNGNGDDFRKKHSDTLAIRYIDFPIDRYKDFSVE